MLPPLWLQNSAYGAVSIQLGHGAAMGTCEGGHPLTDASLYWRGSFSMYVISLNTKMGRTNRREFTGRRIETPCCTRLLRRPETGLKEQTSGRRAASERQGQSERGCCDIACVQRK